MSNIISTNSMVIALSVAGDTVVAGFLNGVIMTSAIGNRDLARQLATNACPPFALAVTYSNYVCFGGCDGKITFLNCNQDARANNRQTIEFGSDLNCASSAPSGNIVIVSAGDKFVIFALEGQYWRQTQVIELSGGYLLTGLFWSKDGTKLLVTTLNGAIELFTFQWKKKLIGDNFEANYVGSNQVVVKDVTTKETSVYRSAGEIKDIHIVRERFAVIWTQSSLILGELKSAERTSEIDWSGMVQDGVKFCFDYDGVVLAYVVGELYLIELGSNQLLASVRTEFVNPHLMR